MNDKIKTQRLQCMCCAGSFFARSKAEIQQNEISKYLCDECLIDVVDNTKIDYVNPFANDFEFEITSLICKDGRTTPRFSE